jgi:hypothetical protein
MNRKTILCLGLVVSAVIAFATPATASAYTFEYEGGPIPEPVQVILTGALNWVNGSGTGWDCSKVSTAWDAETKDAKVTMIDIETGSCTGTGAYKGCTMTGDMKTGLPWTAIPTGKAVDYQNGTIDYKYSCAGGSGSSGVSFETLTGTVDNPAAIKKENISGSGTSEGKSVTFSGEFEVTGAAAGKLSIVE